jgi:hypothetical protein
MEDEDKAIIDYNHVHQFRYHATACAEEPRDVARIVATRARDVRSHGGPDPARWNEACTCAGRTGLERAAESLDLITAETESD